ncbi:hypothetical protein CXP39_01915 [Mesoplasma syrphidae]|uniref:ATP-binding protein n=1 Tax=Mesoplasma syrphidae TaxID=225999 RepID=A0A2K9C5I1_9MOLU|nr:ATP-binding protein [Mesoplasma syrphidae]AUF83547.1 hypothetical protein CXP39_01915 [Mesoplasma syrphidae]
MEKKEIDISPKTSIYKAFKRMSYQLETAIAEFIDNSTSSYFDHKDELENIYKLKNQTYKLKIYVLYGNMGKPEDSFLQIKDNAYGMNFDDFQRAIRLNDIPKDRSGRNEFGMGLKTAGVWFANELRITSSSLTSNEQYKIVLNVDDLEREEANTLRVETKEVSELNHGTTIFLKNMSNVPKSKIQKQNLIDLLSSIYRNDLETGSIEIILAEYKKSDGCWYDFNGNKYGKTSDAYINIPSIQWENKKIYVIKEGEKNNPQNADYEVKTTFDDYIDFEGTKYKVFGWIGALEISSRKWNGFALLRRGRVITGGKPYSGYKVKEISGQSGSFEDIRIIGEINMDNFPVNQAKDGFSWNNGLEDAFIDFLINKTDARKIKKIAHEIRKKEPVNIEIFKDKKYKKDVNKEIKESFKNSINTETEITINDIELDSYQKSNDILEHIEIVFEDYLTGEVTNINYLISNKKEPTNWIDILINNDDKYSFILYIDHEFIKPFSSDQHFLKFIKQFVSAYATSMIFAIKNDLGIESINLQMNKFLKGYK